VGVPGKTETDIAATMKVIP